MQSKFLAAAVLTGLMAITGFGEPTTVTGHKVMIDFSKGMYAEGSTLAVTPQVVRLGTNLAVTAEKVYYASGTTWLMASNTSVATANGLLGYSVGTDSRSNGMITVGSIVNTNWSFTVGDRVYLGTTPGSIVTAAPSASVYTRVLGFATSSNEIYFNPAAFINAGLTSTDNDLVVTNVTIKQEYSGTVYDSTGTALTNAAGVELNFVTNNTLTLERGTALASVTLE